MSRHIHVSRSIAVQNAKAAQWMGKFFNSPTIDLAACISRWEWKKNLDVIVWVETS